MTEQPTIPPAILIVLIFGSLIAIIGLILAIDHRKKDSRYGNGYKDNAPPPGCLKRIVGLIMLLIGLAIASVGLNKLPKNGEQQNLGNHTEIKSQQVPNNNIVNHESIENPKE